MAEITGPPEHVHRGCCWGYRLWIVPPPPNQVGEGNSSTYGRLVLQDGGEKGERAIRLSYRILITYLLDFLASDDSSREKPGVILGNKCFSTCFL